MPRKGHSEEKIVYALRQVEGGRKVSEICRWRALAEAWGKVALAVCAGRRK
jgi:hypothetical protein